MHASPHSHFVMFGYYRGWIFVSVCFTSRISQMFRSSLSFFHPPFLSIVLAKTAKFLEIFQFDFDLCVYYISFWYTQHTCTYARWTCKLCTYLRKYIDSSIERAGQPNRFVPTLFWNITRWHFFFSHIQFYTSTTSISVFWPSFVAREVSKRRKGDGYYRLRSWMTRKEFQSRLF